MLQFDLYRKMDLRKLSETCCVRFLSHCPLDTSHTLSTGENKKLFFFKNLDLHWWSFAGNCHCHTGFQALYYSEEILDPGGHPKERPTLSWLPKWITVLINTFIPWTCVRSYNSYLYFKENEKSLSELPEGRGGERKEALENGLRWVISRQMKWHFV